MAFLHWQNYLLVLEDSVALATDVSLTCRRNGLPVSLSIPLFCCINIKMR